MVKLLIVLLLGLSVGSVQFDSVQAANDDVAVNTIIKKKSPTPTPNAKQDTQIRPYRAQYNLRSSNIPLTANAIHTLKRLPDGKAQINTQARALFSELTETALIKWQNCDSQSITYDYARQLFNKTVNYQQAFDSHQMLYLRAGRSITIPLNTKAPVDDRLLSQLKLRCHVKSGEKKFTLLVLDKDQIKTQSFQVIGNENLRLPIGDVKSIKVERLRDHSSKRSTSIWLAPQWDYVVVKAIQEVDHEVVTLELTELEFL